MQIAFPENYNGPGVFHPEVLLNCFCDEQFLTYYDRCFRTFVICLIAIIVSYAFGAELWLAFLVQIIIVFDKRAMIRLIRRWRMHYLYVALCHNAGWSSSLDK